MADIKTLADIREMKVRQSQAEEVLTMKGTFTGESSKTVFNPDGSITRTKLQGEEVTFTETTTFPTEDTIVKVATIGTKTITTTITFNPDGSISEVVV